MIKLNAKQLRSHQSTAISRQKGGKHEIYIILDNVLDTYNIGSIFRLADAVAAKKVYLCGGSATPPNPRIKKASINTTEWVDWEYTETAVQAVRNLQFSIPNLQIVAVEQSHKSIPYDQFEYKLPIAIVIGHETYGVSQETLEVVDGVVEMPMFGVNISLNVVVSSGIVLYQIISQANLASSNG